MQLQKNISCNSTYNCKKKNCSVATTSHIMHKMKNKKEEAKTKEKNKK
jgi:hypothetical protein